MNETTATELRKQFPVPYFALIPTDEATDETIFYDVVKGEAVRPSEDIIESRKKAAKYSSEIDAARVQIQDNMAELDSTDYQQAKWLDGDVSEEEYAPMKARRAELRQEIRNLRAKYPELEKPKIKDRIRAELAKPETINLD